MRRLWLLSSLIIIVFTAVSIIGCKAKRSSKTVKAVELKNEESVSEKTEESIESEADISIHRPGTINPTQLDSIKAAKKKLKRKIK